MRPRSICSARAHQHRSDRRAQPLRQAEHHRVGLGRQLVDRNAQRHRRIEDARAIEMHRQSGLVGAVADLVEDLRRSDRSARHVVRVLQRDQAGLRRVIALAAQLRLDVLPGEDAVFGPHRARHHAGEVRHHRHLVVEDVAALLADDLLPMRGVQLDRDLVAHGSAGHEQRRLAAEDLSRALLQPVDGRVFAVNVVADLGFEHGAPHLGRGLGDGVAAQVDGGGGGLGGVAFGRRSGGVHDCSQCNAGQWRQCRRVRARKSPGLRKSRDPGHPGFSAPVATWLVWRKDNRNSAVG